MSNTLNEVSPVQLYHEVWRRVAKSFIDEKRLGNWSEWEHKFDERIATCSEAVRYINTMLDALGDRFTKLIVPDCPIRNLMVAMGFSTTPGAQHVETRSEDSLSVASARMLDAQVGYLKWTTFRGADLPNAVEQELNRIRPAKAFIIDLRDNSGGLVWNAGELMSLFMDEGEGWTMRVRDADAGYGKVVFMLKGSHLEQVTKCDDDAYPVHTHTKGRRSNLAGNKPIVLLVNENSGSATETFADIMRDHKRAFIVGERTAGKGIGQTMFELGGGYKLQITDTYVFSPSGEWRGDCGQTVRNGLVPDLTVKQCYGRDAQLEAAMNHLQDRPQPVDSPNGWRDAPAPARVPSFTPSNLIWSCYERI